MHATFASSDIGQSTEMLAMLADSQLLFDAGRHVEGERCARDVLDHAVAMGNAHLQARACDLVSQHLFRLGRLTQSAGAAERALALLPVDCDIEQRAAIHCRLALTFDTLGLHAASLKHATAAVDAARDLDNVALLCEALSRLGAARATSVDPGRGQRLFEQALALARRENDGQEMFRAINNLSSMFAEVVAAANRDGDRARALEAVKAGLARSDEAVALAEDSGIAYRLAIALLNRSGLLREAGRHDEAIACCDRADPIARQVRNVELASWLTETRARSLVETGRPREAVSLLEAAIVEAESLDDAALDAGLRETAYFACKQAGDIDAALLHLETLLRVERARNDRRAEAEIEILLERSEIQSTRIAAEHSARDAELQRLRASQLQAERDLLEAHARELNRHAFEDSLTGLPNRRRAEEAMGALLARVGQGASIACVALLDLDHFKRINDTYGHGVGDEVLRVIGAIMTRGLRDSDFVARMGGEEFVLLLEHVSPEAIRDACERVRRAVDTHDWSSIRPSLRVTASIGASVIGEPCSPNVALARADDALYTAKRAGRNRVVMHERVGD